MKIHLSINGVTLAIMHVCLGYIVDRFTLRGVVLDPLTIRSWIFGSTMAPLLLEHMKLLVEILDLGDVDCETVFSSVKKLRTIARSLGRVLNSLILRNDFEDIDSSLRDLLGRAGIDVEELSDAIESRVVIRVSKFSTEIEAANLGKLGRMQ